MCDPGSSEGLSAEVVGLLGFVEVVRGLGVGVSADSALTFVQAVGEIGVEEGSGVYWAGRATLVRRVEDVPAYDRAFLGFFGDLPVLDLPHVARPVELLLDVGGDDGADGDDDAAVAGDTRPVRWSDREVLRHRDFADCTPEELDEAHRLIADLRVHAALRRSRRRRPARPGSRGRPDLRRTLRSATRTGGEVLRPAVTRPGERPRRLVLLVDVSGSMAPYSRALARFAHAAVAARRHGQVEVFAVGTRVTRITRELSTHDPDEALTRASGAVDDWSGGTRLGHGLRNFNDRWGTAGIGRGAVVVILSDGWDRGDPTVLGEEMARLHRVAHRIVWVNPLKALPGYAPLAQGMAAALPHVDDFLEGHSVASLQDLAKVVGT